jgi:oligopeptide/dipeptide ABC transporter ATP-binding protein
MYIGKVMEESPTEELFAIPLHPYTHALFSSIPSLDPAKRRGLNPLPGEPPSPADPPPGCRFASRCPKVTAKCREGDIEVVEVSKNHRVRCILYG